MSDSKTDTNTSSLEALDKDIEIQTLHSDSHDSEIIEEVDDASNQESDVESGKGQIQKINSSEKEGFRNEKLEAVTRTSTKSSWKDPGPPPDGGLVGWTQGIFAPTPSKC